MAAGMSRRRVLGAGAELALMTGVGLDRAMAAPVLAPLSARPRPARPAKPLVLGHRGAPAHRPEHTLGSYAKAIADGADFIEPDLVATRDGVLVARHENNIAETTDVSAHPEFAARQVAKTIDGQTAKGWFTEDFTLAELKTLRAKERLGAARSESQAYDGAFQIVTFDEIADFAAAESAARGRTIGLIPEIKHSTYSASIGLPLEPRFVAALRAHAYLRTAPVIVQSFEVANLKALHGELTGMANVQLMQLVDAEGAPADRVARFGGRPSYAEMLTPGGLADVATYADWIAPYKTLLIPVDAAGKLAASTGLAATAHAAGLLVGTWTFRPENHFLPAGLRVGADPARNVEGSVTEIRRYLAEGVDAFFTDDPAIGRQAVDGNGAS